MKTSAKYKIVIVFTCLGKASGYLFDERERGGDGEGDPEPDAFRVERSGSHAAHPGRSESG